MTDVALQQTQADCNSASNGIGSRSVQTATGDSEAKKTLPFNTQKLRLYSEDVYVFIKKTNEQTFGKLHPMQIGYILHKKLNIPNIKQTDLVGLNRVRVHLKSMFDANKLILNKCLASEELRAFIPNSYFYYLQDTAASTNLVIDGGIDTIYITDI